jgi:hypothetical protein
MSWLIISISSPTFFRPFALLNCWVARHANKVPPIVSSRALNLVLKFLNRLSRFESGVGADGNIVIADEGAKRIEGLIGYFL